MDLEKYIEAKFCEFKFPLVDKTEKEVNEFKSRLNARGVLHSGQFITGSYEIRLGSKKEMVKKYLDLEIELRREKSVKFDEEIFIKIEKKIKSFIEYEFENLISKTKEESNTIKFGVDNFEKNFKPKIIRDRDSLISDLKKKLEIKKFELAENKSGPKILEGYFDVAEICTNGHIINPNIKKSPKFRKPYCDECGAKTITECPKCKKSIPGRFIYKDFEDSTIWSSPPKFCKYCGNPYPWAEKLASEFLNNTETQDFDAFLSHADEDKKSIADELYKRLTNDGFKIWYDKSMKAGQSIPEEINEGIKHSKNGIVIFSNYYDKSQWCKEEFSALTYKSKSYKSFNIIIILHNFNLEIFKKEYPIHAHRLILSSKIGIDKIISEIKPSLRTKPIEDEKEEKKDNGNYLKISTDAIIEYYDFNPEKNNSINNHSKKIILENLKEIPLTITNIFIRTDFPVIQNFFNSHAKIDLNKEEYKFDPTGEIEIPLNQNPLTLSPKANISLILSLYTSTKVRYKREYNFNYSININEFPKKSEGNFKMQATVIKR